MNEEKFTDDNEFSELKNLLKELPKVGAPDNFEFNLMTKIQNQNFEVKSEKKKNVFSWALTPAIAFAASVFLVFFIFSGEESLEENSWDKAPRLIEKSIAETKTPNPMIENKGNKLNSNSNEQKVDNSTQKDFPFDNRSSVSLDDGLQSGSKSATKNGSAQLAGTSNNNTSPFNGFFLREVEKFQKKDSLKSKNDSTSQNDNESESE